MNEEPNAAPNPKIRHTALVPCIDGKPIETPGVVEAARLKLAEQLLVRDIEWCVRREGKLVPIALEDVQLEEEVLVLQNMAAFPESPRGLIAALASVRVGRAESERRARERNTPEARARQEAERLASQRAGEESTRHLTEGTP